AAVAGERAAPFSAAIGWRPPGGGGRGRAKKKAGGGADAEGERTTGPAVGPGPRPGKAGGGEGGGAAGKTAAAHKTTRAPARPATGRADDHAVHEQLLHDAAAAGAKSEPQRQVPIARRRPDGDERRDVRGGDEQQAGDGSQQEQHRRTDVADDRLVERDSSR